MIAGKARSLGVRRTVSVVEVKEPSDGEETVREIRGTFLNESMVGGTGDVGGKEA